MRKFVLYEIQNMDYDYAPWHISRYEITEKELKARVGEFNDECFELDKCIDILFNREEINEN